MNKKIRYSDFTTPAPAPLSRFTPVSTPSVGGTAPTPTPAMPVPVAAGQAPAPQPVSRPRRNSTPIDLARALAQARATEAAKAAETLAHVEVRAAAAHARGLARAEAEAALLGTAVGAATPAATPTLAPDDVTTRDVVAPDIAAPHAIAFVSHPVTAPVVMEPARTATAPVRARRDDDEDEEWDEEDEEDEEVAEPRGPRRPLRERARSRDSIAELLMFRIGTERFAVELMCVEEAIDLPEVHHVPEMPPAMLGVITVRGALTPVFTPDAALGVPVRGNGAALIFRSDRGRFALAIDDVDDVMTLDLAQLRDAPGSEVADSVVLGVARHESAIVALVDADALIAACQALPVLELA